MEQEDTMLETRRKLWLLRLNEYGCNQDEAEECVRWLEAALVDAYIAEWVAQGRIRMRWSETGPVFTAVTGRRD